MKHLLLVLLLFILSLSSQAQQNLVPNPSFEDTVYCPNATNQIDACQHWLNFGNSPDYFNACDPTGLNVPNSSFGFQYAHSGNGMAGLVTYRRPNAPSGPHYREFIGIQLSNSLLIGIKYFISFYTNSSNKFGLASSKIGLRLSSVPFDSCCKPPITNNAHLYTNSILKDSIAWIRLDTSIIADSAYNYLIIGNFFNDFSTDTAQLGINDYSYYYIDDVCISTDSIYNNTWTGVVDNSFKNEILIYPNPTQNTVNIKSINQFNEITIVEFTGKIVFHEHFNQVNDFSFEIPLSIISGFYYVKLKHRNSISVHKLVVQF